MGVYYTAACHPCRKTLDFYKTGAAFRNAAKHVDGEPAPVITAGAVRDAIGSGSEYIERQLQLYVAAWVEEHTAHGPVLLLGSHEATAHDAGAGPDDQ